ncbi:hypothetical protein AB0E63_29790 [Kribbella sp. NPDC026596]
MSEWFGLRPVGETTPTAGARPAERPTADSESAETPLEEPSADE